MTPLRRSGPAAAVVVALVLLVVAANGCTGSGHKPIPPPPTTSVSVTSPPEPPDLSGVALAGASGHTSTTKVALTPGHSAISGQVVGPDGPVAGATVRVERLVGDSVGSMDVFTAVDGTWQAPPPPPAPAPPDPNAPTTQPAITTTTTQPVAPPGILGGRYRVRAWKAPDLALTTPSVLFLGGAEQKQLPLQLARYTGLAVTSNVAPSPPMVGDLVNVAVLVTTRSVDANGVVRALGVPGASTSLSGGSGWQVIRGDSQTDGSGKAVFELKCTQEGPQPLVVAVNGTASFTVPVAACVPPPPSTTTSSSIDTGSSTTTTSGGGGTTTTRRSTSTTSRSTTTL